MALQRFADALRYVEGLRLEDGATERLLLTAMAGAVLPLRMHLSCVRDAGLESLREHAAGRASAPLPDFYTLNAAITRCDRFLGMAEALGGTTVVVPGKAFDQILEIASTFLPAETLRDESQPESPSRLEAGPAASAAPDRWGAAAAVAAEPPKGPRCAACGDPVEGGEVVEERLLCPECAREIVDGELPMDLLTPKVIPGARGTGGEDGGPSWHNVERLIEGTGRG